jgi:signal transduction histidine kinase
VTGDPTLLRRALHNLIANALRHAPEGSVVRLSAREGAEGVALEVEDQGEGIPAEAVAKLGQRFLRPDPSRSRGSGGAGLGLAIVQGIARMHGGRLEVVRLEPAGTLARLVLPPT